MRTPFIIAALALAVLGAVVAGCGLLDDDGQAQGPAASSKATPTPVTPPEDALRHSVERRLSLGFVDDCDEARRPDDTGKQCARLRGIHNGMRAYELGPTFGEYSRLLILEQAGDSWTIAHLERRTPGQPAVPGIPWPLAVGETVVVAVVDDCLRVREHPGVQAPEVACLEAGTVATIQSGPVEIDDHQWWQLVGYGWSASDWLRYPEDPSASDPVTPEG